MGTEGVQGAIGKPPGRARRRETLALAGMHRITFKKDKAVYFASGLKGALQNTPSKKRRGKEPQKGIQTSSFRLR